ncbi:RNA guanine-N7 methyltransferase activating subunit [Spea bombifrons]|uniref:RNA guanine-N7 methyltransferase activating subunit n=1 Tax=Spea bombifrons TaxID=233779 RepID=UPI00234B48E9|nr:RNA guanine-N7 methyltransferase activating subunit [Spea bombifrons]
MTSDSDPQRYENMFAHRFTADDKEYQDYLKKPESVPPIVEDYKFGNQRSHDRYRDNRHRRGWERQRDWSNNSYNQPRGGRGWGNSYNHQEGHYGYNPSNQRFHSDRY